MPSCAVKICKNNNKRTKGRNIRYHRFPKKKQLIEKWLVACDLPGVHLKNATVCSEHFDSNCYIKIPESLQLIAPLAKNAKALLEDAIPTQALRKKPEHSRMEPVVESVFQPMVESLLEPEVNPILELVVEPMVEVVVEPEGEQEVELTLKERILDLERLLAEKTLQNAELRKENCILKDQVVKCNTNITVMQQEINKRNLNFGKHFTLTQIKLIKNPHKKVQK